MCPKNLFDPTCKHGQSTETWREGDQLSHNPHAIPFPSAAAKVSRTERRVGNAVGAPGGRGLENLEKGFAGGGGGEGKGVLLLFL